MDELHALLAELTSGDDARAEAAANRLPAFPVSVLDPLLQSDDIDTRWWALRALAGFQSDENIVRRLVSALEDGSDEIRQCAALGLCHHPHPEAVLPLIRALSSPDSMTARLAANALIAIGAEAVPHLIEVLRRATPSVQLEAAHALAEIGDLRAIPALMEVLQSDSALSTYWAQHGLDKLGLNMVYIKPQ